jgi:hypothetical protein
MLFYLIFISHQFQLHIIFYSLTFKNNNELHMLDTICYSIEYGTTSVWCCTIVHKKNGFN